MNTPCTPHPLAHPILFKHKRAILSVFRDVIGINDIDHLSIACITHTNEVMFLSHTPSIEYHLMTSPLWSYDLLHTPHFYKNDDAKSWSELYHPDQYADLHAIKQAKHGFTTGFSIPIKRHGMHLVYSFATKSPNIHSNVFCLEKHDEFLRLGHYCFNQLSYLVLPHSAPRPHVKLVVNNARIPSVHSKNIEES
ncbi:MAG TPA: hypothetical protein DDY37_05230 [Legionella sp.]|nr:hypothetical protein [Legionella sp.]